MDNLDIFLVSKNFHSSITEVLLFFVVSLLSGRYIYNKLKNKNKNYPPGPIGIPVLGYWPFLGAKPHKALFKLKKKYGDIIGLYLGSKYTVVLNEWTAVKEVLPHTNALNKSPNIFDQFPNFGFTAANGKRWVEQRRFCMSALRDLGVGRERWEITVMEGVQIFINQLQQSKGKPIDFAHHLSYSISSNILAHLIGRRYQKGEEPEKIQLSLDFVDVFSPYAGPTNLPTVLPWIRKYFQMFKIAGYDKASRIFNSFSQMLGDEITQQKTSPESRDVNCFINTYLQKISELKASSNEKQHYFSESMLNGNMNLLFAGASDTVFISVGWLFRLMAHHTDVQEKVYSELMTVLGKERAARYEERHEIPYTFAVMMESQRFSSIVSLGTTRWANGDISLRGYTIPKGAEIIVNFWALHRDPEYWDEPEKFKPDRFLQDDGRTLVKSPKSYAPFSVGRRNCPGETIAWMESLCYFSEIIKKFEISTVDEQKPEFEIVNGLVDRLKFQPLCFKERAQQ